MPHTEPPKSEPEPDPATLTESVVIPRFIARAAARNAGEAESLVRAAGLSAALHGPATDRTPSANTYLLWAAVLAHSRRSDAGLLAAGHYRPGSLDLFDYLLSTAPTVGAALGTASAHIKVVSSNSLMPAEQSDDEVTVGYDVRLGDGELRGVVAEFSLALLTGALRHATGTELSPLRVSFAHKAPRRHDGYLDAFGSAQIEFDAAADAITLHRRELAQPLVTADASLAAIIGRAVAALPVSGPPAGPPDPADPAGESPVPGLYAAIIAQLPYGRPSLAVAAQSLAVSPRTLQRRLEEYGTTWRRELDTVRREQSAGLRRAGTSAAQYAARLGFAESRSLRRAMSRWDAGDGEPAPAPCDTKPPE